jgi:meiotically up-regulated gene 157 (Mug157) protein
MEGGVSFPLSFFFMFSSKRPSVSDRSFTSPAVEACILEVSSRIKDPEIAWLFSNCFPNTLDTTVRAGKKDGKPDTFVITGDIPAMWLRDSAAQVWPYLPLAKEDPALKTLLEGVLRRQVACVLIDPYANAFTLNSDDHTEWKKDHTEMKPGVFERKYELDSLGAVLRLSTGYYDATGDKTPFDAAWARAIDVIIETIAREQQIPGEGEKPVYRFQRTTPHATDTLPLGGRGNPALTCGLSRCAFRPSDDATTMPFLIPANAMVVVGLRKVARLCADVLKQPERAKKAQALSEKIDEAIHKHGIVAHPKLGQIFAYEVDGYGSFYFMDDANVPSLLSLPYLGYCSLDESTYRATRAGVLSTANPYYSKGKAAAGIGGPHIGRGHIWPMSIILQIMTSNSEEEVVRCLDMLKKTHAGTGFMHESFWKDDPSKFTRSWFAWVNTLFGEMILHLEHKWPGLLKKG